MRRFSSYHYVVESDPYSGPAYLGGVWEIDFEDRDAYRVSSLALGVGSAKDCEVFDQEEDRQQCQEVMSSFTSRSILESVLSGDNLYLRECAYEQRDTCTPWLVVPPLPPPVAGDDWVLFPESPLVALELVEDLGYVEASPQGSALHLRGKTNPARVDAETFERIFGESQVDGHGIECEGYIGIVGAGERTIEREDSCREVANGADSNDSDEVQYYEDNPVQLDVWLSPTDFRVQRLRLAGRSPVYGDQTVVEIIYSRFNRSPIAVPNTNN
jgi:hypothetical protein